MNKNNSSQPRPLRLALAALFWVAVWQVVAMAVGQGILLASPVDTLARLVALVQTGDFWRSVLFTLGHILAGYALASAAGIALATLAARCAAVADLLAPLLSAMRSVPVASFVIAALIWVPSRRLSLLIVAVIVLPVVYAGTLDGLEGDGKGIPHAPNEPAALCDAARADAQSDLGAVGVHGPGLEVRRGRRGHRHPRRLHRRKAVQGQGVPGDP